MKADLAAKLGNAMRGEVTRKYPVTRVERVTGVECNTSKSLMLHRYTCNSSKSVSLENDATERVTRGVTIPPEPDEAELVQRAAIAVELGGVPAAYADSWARLQCQRPMGVTNEDWQQAIIDGGVFLDRWGSLALEFQWTAGELFDVPRDGATGLVWWLKGRTVTALGPEHAGVGQPAYDRVTRRDWFNPYARPVRPVSLSPILEHQLKIMQRVLGR